MNDFRFIAHRGRKISLFERICFFMHNPILMSLLASTSVFIMIGDFKSGLMMVVAIVVFLIAYMFRHRVFVQHVCVGLMIASFWFLKYYPTPFRIVWVVVIALFIIFRIVAIVVMARINSGVYYLHENSIYKDS